MPQFFVPSSSSPATSEATSCPSPSSRTSEVENSSYGSDTPSKEMADTSYWKRSPSHIELGSVTSSVLPRNNIPTSSIRHGVPSDFFPDYFGVSKRCARRRHPVVFLTMVFFILWACWTTTAMFQFSNLSDPLSIWVETPGTGTSRTVRIVATADTTSLGDTIVISDNANTQQQAVTSSSRTLSTPLIRGTSTHSIPLPLPKEKVSVVLMNYGRPRMIRESTMMRTLLSHPNVDEVLLLHANPKTAFEFVHPKVKNIDAIEHNNEMGLSLRFYFCQLAENRWVLHLDDDMEFTPEALNELLIEYGRNPKRIVGRFGRDLTPGNSFHGYNSQNRHKSTEVVLTKLMIMERETCSKFFEYAHLVWNDVILHDGEGPLWNGEDIFMSLVANHVYGRPKDGSKFNNYAMDWLNVWQADDSLKDYDNGKYDISGGMRGIRFWDWRWWQTLLRRNRHYSYRGRLWQLARDRLQELTSPILPSKSSSSTPS
jgi:hypothetical protein